MTHDDQSQDNFDPQAEFYDEDGFRYRNFGAWLAQDKDICPLNRRLAHVKAVYKDTRNDCAAYTAWISVCWQEDERRNPQDGDINRRWDRAVADAKYAFSASDGVHPRECGCATRAGVARAGAPPTDAFHPADEPEIPRRVGP